MSYLPYGDAGAGSWLAASGSATLVHGGIFALALGGFAPIWAAQDVTQPDEPQFRITLEVLDADALSGLTQQSGLDGVDQTDTETVSPKDGEELAALTPDPAPDAAGETVAPNPSDRQTATVPDALAAVPPENDGDELQPETVAPNQPEIANIAPSGTLDTIEDIGAETTNGLEPLETEQVSPEPAQTVAANPVSDVMRAAPVEPIDAVSETPAAVLPPESPLISEGPLALAPTRQSVTPGATNSGSLPPVTTPRAQAVDRVEVAPSAPASRPDRQVLSAVAAPPAETIAQPPRSTPAPSPTPAPSAQDLAIGDLLGRIRASEPLDCLNALPRRDGAGGVGIALIAGSDAEITGFQNNVLTDDDTDIRLTRAFIDPRQCPVLTYVRQNRDYPATRLGVRLEASEIENRGRLKGRLRGIAGRYLLLLLIDANGVVTDLQPFVTYAGPAALFDVPVTRTGPERDTSQILLAIATTQPATELRARAGQLAADVFSDLEGELATGAALAITTFDVR